jgi:hypothetical protein|tara:strand:+ start:2084 stop:3448 length:1365 start_codon:yes stop_codon:yes gene_type:complete
VKSFGQFIIEAVKTAASTEAKMKGLKGDGHGGWYDQKGNFVAKTVNGKLKFTGGRSAAPEEDPKSTKVATPEKPTAKPKAVATAPIPKPKPKEDTAATATKSPEPGETDQQTAEVMGIPSSEGVVVVFGRFNPPTVGHQKLLDKAASEASRLGYDFKIYPSRSVDAKKNPLQPGAKIEYMKKMFSDYEESIKDDPNARTIFDVLVAAANLGYKGVTIVVGQDRLSEFQSLAQKYNGDLYNFEDLQVISAGARDPDSDGIEGMSASKMRDAVAKDDFKAFAKGIPNIGNMEKKNLFNLIQKSMGATDEQLRGTVASETWQHAPKLDPFGLRVAYLKEQCFKVGSLVENVNTGVRGRITRRCANHVIVQTPEHTMFKAWLKDLAEAYDVGTDEYRQYMQRMTPGQGDKKWNNDPIIKPITTGSYYDGKKVKNPNDPASGPGVKYNDTKIPYKVGKG